MTIFLLSGSLCSLDSDSYDTSSQKFEYEFAYALSSYAKVVILSKALSADARSGYEELELRGIGGEYRSRIDRAISIITACSRDRVLIFWGYDLLHILFMRRVRKRCKIKTIPFIYDSHKEVIKKFGRWKRTAADIYFSIGRSLVRHFDGALLFQEKAAQKLKIRKSYLITKPGVWDQPEPPYVQNDRAFVVTYAGSFTELNGIQEMLKAFAQIKRSDIQLHLYGYGIYLDMVKEYALMYDNIFYEGVRTNKELKEIYRRSQILMNVRHTDDECMDFAFPSKLFEMMNTGVPVITTGLLEDPRFRDCTFVLDEESSDAVRDAVLTVYAQYPEFCERADHAKEYVSINYNYKRLSKEIFTFLYKLISEE